MNNKSMVKYKWMQNIIQTILIPHVLGFYLIIIRRRNQTIVHMSHAQFFLSHIQHSLKKI